MGTEIALVLGILAFIFVVDSFAYWAMSRYIDHTTQIEKEEPR